MDSMEALDGHSAALQRWAACEEEAAATKTGFGAAKAAGGGMGGGKVGAGKKAKSKKR